MPSLKVKGKTFKTQKAKMAYLRSLRGKKRKPVAQKRRRKRTQDFLPTKRARKRAVRELKTDVSRLSRRLFGRFL